MDKRVPIVFSFFLIVAILAMALSGQSGNSVQAQDLSKKLATQDKLIKALEARLDALEKAFVTVKKEVEAPAYDSGWYEMWSLGMTHRFDHNLASKGYQNANKYVVDLEFKDEQGNINTHWYGGHYDRSELGVEQQGAYWYYLTNTSICVTRCYTDTVARWVRVRIWVYK